MSHEGYVRRCNGLPFTGTRHLTPDERSLLAQRGSIAQRWAWLWIAAAGGCLVLAALSTVGAGWPPAAVFAVAGGITLTPMLAARQWIWAAWFRESLKADSVEIYEGEFLDLPRWEQGDPLDEVVVPGRIEVVTPTAWYWETGAQGPALRTDKALLAYVAEPPAPMPEGQAPLSELERAELQMHSALTAARIARSRSGLYFLVAGAAVCAAIGWTVGAIVFAVATVASWGAMNKRTQMLRLIDADLADGRVAYNTDERSARLPHTNMHWVICGQPAPWRFDQPWVRFKPAEVTPAKEGLP
jgi:hypothetical protein